jgi:subtilisin family serine protease
MPERSGSRQHQTLQHAAKWAYRLISLLLTIDHNHILLYNSGIVRSVGANLVFARSKYRLETKMLCKDKNSQIWRAALPFLLLISLLCWLASLGATYASPLRKLDPDLKLLLLTDGKPNAAPRIPLRMMSARQPDLINAIIKVSGNPMAIESAGARVRSVIGNIVTADVPVRSLNDLVDLSNVIYIQAARQMQPALLDVSVPDTRADQVWQSTPGYTGKGVIVGIIDAGIDWRHPDFKNDDGTSRILYIWDQTVESLKLPNDFDGFPGYGYGTEWTKAHIDSGQCHEMDATSHGTHIASTIAGDGRGSHEFTGMAPEADIIAVKSGFEDADVLDAADYIFRRAAELGRPAVINMSFGSHWGPHDGTRLLDQAIDELLDRPGRVIVAAAGNDGGGSPVHIGTPSLRRPIDENYPWMAISPSVGTQSIMVQIWYAPAGFLSVRLLLPENDLGDLRDPGMEWVSEGQFRHFSVPSGPLAGAEVVIDAQQLASELLYPDFDSIYVRISDNGDLTIPIDEYIYAIEYDGAGVGLDAYVVWGGSFTTKLPGSVSFPNRQFLLEGDGDKTIISPASASSAICVGSYVTKSEWVDSENRIRTESLKMDDISVFSSRGPLLNGARKPDIAAPGEMIVAAFSAESWSRPRSIYRDGEHVSWRGTSMSAPHVAGAVALMYEQNPRLTASEVKNMLTSAAIDRGPAGWDKAWGYGKLDVLAAMGIPSIPLGLKATTDDDSITVIWLLNRESDVAGYRIYSTLDAGCWMLDTAYWMLDAGCWDPDAGCWTLDAGHWEPDTGCWMRESSVEYPIPAYSGISTLCPFRSARMTPLAMKVRSHMRLLSPPLCPPRKGGETEMARKRGGTEAGRKRGGTEMGRKRG